jgi:glycosyltransferase involved in cell wall biosynthesis
MKRWCNLSKRVEILLSTFNGAPWLTEQIDSITNQDYPEINLRIRDDGSTDTTREVLDGYKRTHPDWNISSGQNIGIFKSYMQLLQSTDSQADYFAFADQDDVWMKNKVSRAVEHLDRGPSLVPAIYYSRLEFVDEQLRHTGWSSIPTQSGFHTALVQNQAFGCTCVINASARELILQSVPEWALMHDWWCYLVVSAFGQVIYDPEPTIKYRKHGSNVTPAAPNFAIELVNRFRRYMSDRGIVMRVGDQAMEFYKRYGDRLNENNRTIIRGFLDARKRALGGRIHYAFSMPLRRNTPLDTLIMRILILIGRF